ncbi:MAG: hypothetical protein ACPLKP_03840 [Microgenomates group bacterium]
MAEQLLDDPFNTIYCCFEPPSGKSAEMIFPDHRTIKVEMRTPEKTEEVAMNIIRGVLNEKLTNNEQLPDLKITLPTGEIVVVNFSSEMTKTPEGPEIKMTSTTIIPGPTTYNF